MLWFNWGTGEPKHRVRVKLYQFKGQHTRGAIGLWCNTGNVWNQSFSAIDIKTMTNKQTGSNGPRPEGRGLFLIPIQKPSGQHSPAT
jgi:hypothetical protein